MSIKLNYVIKPTLPTRERKVDYWSCGYRDNSLQQLEKSHPQFIISPDMQPEANTKRNIFRASLRREFIDSYQRSIRMKYLSLQSHQPMHPDHDRLKQPDQNITTQLERILKLSYDEICKIDHFDFFVLCVETVAKKNNGGSDISCKANTHQILPPTSQSYMTENNYILEEPRISKSTHVCWQRKSEKISGTWVHKQKIYCLLYRILDRVLSEDRGQLWYVIDRVLYLLEFPELMPLWERLASTGDQKSKNYCCREFSKKILKPPCISTFESHIILDPDFVLDILTSFIVQAPCVSFDNMLELMPFISYALRMQTERSQQCQDHDANYPILNKVCIIMRSILKEDSKFRMTRMVDCGYTDIFVALIQQTFDLLGYETKESPNQIVDIEEECRWGEKSMKNIVYRLQCGSTQNSLCYKPANLQIVAKTNLIKLLNRLFVSHPHIATFLFLKVRNPYFLYSLFYQFLNPLNICTAQTRGSSFPQLQAQQKYPSIILCDSHRTFLKTILTTVHTLLISGSIVGYSFVLDFLRCEGITFLERCADMERNENKFGKEIVSLMSVLDLEGENFYGKLNEQNFFKFVMSQIEMLCCFGIGYVGQKKKLTTSISSVSINQLIDLRTCLVKQLKLTRNSLLNAYARATQPEIFEKLRDHLMEFSECGQMLEELGRLHDGVGDEQQIQMYSHQIFSLCNDPKLYLQEQNSSRKMTRLGIFPSQI